ncbi:ABC transporter permease subunit, partial [Pseudomonas aeruginosa]|nr:ABC transporter permease subunit [Pseudomonas aeruginosa]
GLLIALVRMLRLPVIDQLLVVYISLARATPLVTLVLFLFLSLPTMGINLDKNVAAIVALTLLITVVMPSEYGIDPTGVGRLLGLKQMGEIKTQLAEEADADNQ